MSTIHWLQWSENAYGDHYKFFTLGYFLAEKNVNVKSFRLTIIKESNGQAS